MESGNNLPRVKVANQAAIKRIIYLHGPITRLEIAKRLDLTLPTITTNVLNLMREGIVKEVSKQETGSSMGRKSNLLDIEASSRYFIGLELRCPVRRACVTDFKGNIVKCLSHQYDTFDFRSVFSSGIELVQKLLEWAEGEGHHIEAIGVCLPGIVDNRKGILKTQLQYDWSDEKVAEDLKAQTGFTGAVVLENDAAARAIGARLFSKELVNQCQSYAYLLVLSGIACPLMYNAGNYVTEPIGPGEIGYMVMEPTYPDSQFKSFGVLSEFAGERAVKEKCLLVSEEGRAPFLASHLESGNRYHFTDLLKAQDAGDEGVDEILTNSAKYLGIAIANFDNVVRPDLFLIEAKIFGNEKNRETFISSADKHAFRHESDSMRFIFLEPEDYSGARGAAAVAIQYNLGEYVE